MFRLSELMMCQGRKQAAGLTTPVYYYISFSKNEFAT